MQQFKKELEAKEILNNQKEALKSSADLNKKPPSEDENSGAKEESEEGTKTDKKKKKETRSRRETSVLSTIHSKAEEFATGDREFRYLEKKLKKNLQH